MRPCRATATATGTIADDDLSTVSITARSTAVTEGSPAVFELSRGIADDGSLAVNLSSSKTGDFITATLPTSATISGGAMSKTLSIATVDDDMTETRRLGDRHHPDEQPLRHRHRERNREH